MCQPTARYISGHPRRQAKAHSRAPLRSTVELKQLTSYPQVNRLLEVILAGLRANLGDKLIGLYAFGSLVTGDFSLARSDLDLAAVLAEDLNETELARLQ